MRSTYATILLITAFLLTACASEPVEIVRDPHNDADEQRKRAEQAQDEMARDTAK